VSSGGDKPLLADGSVVGDYSPLFAYWRKAKEKNRRLAEAAVLRAEDFEFLDQLVRSRGRLSVAEARSKLQEYFSRRIDGRIALKAVREAYGVEGLDEERARSIIAGIMAGWLIEAAGVLKRYKVGSPKPST
jgi:hypothetical protein